MQMSDEVTQRLGASMEALNARIARLAMALDVPLNDRSVVAALMTSPAGQSRGIERRGAASQSRYAP